MKILQVHGVHEKYGGAAFISTYAWVGFKEDGGVCGFDKGAIVGDGNFLTGNSVMYHALLKALTWAKKKGYSGFEVQTCSKLVVNQVSGDWACNTESLLPLVEGAVNLASDLKIKIVYVEKGHLRAVKGAWQVYDDSVRGKASTIYA